MKIDVRRNTILGAVTGISNKLVVTFLPFVMRTIMIHFMGTQYLGLSSLFSSILNMLSLAELGFGSALVYSMYKPIAENDEETICALLNLYRIIYRVIGTVILVAGIAISPFVNHFINGEVPPGINVQVLYFIYLFNTVVSYFLFAYKNSLLAAFQRNDISSLVNTILTAIEYAVQISLVIRFRNYYCYVAVFPIFTIIGNLVRAVIVQRKYPQYVCKGSITRKQKKDIIEKTLALASHKVGNTISTSLDSLVVSSFLGLSSVAIFGNYNYIVTTVMALLWIVYSSMTAGIGNRMNLYSVEDNYNDFRALTTFNNFIICWATGCILFLYQPFMELWAGKENMLGISSVLVFSVYFYVFQSRKIVLLYKDAAGLWREDQLKPLAGAGVNLIFNITLAQIIGIDGVIISSIISFLFIEIPWESRTLYKYYFDKSVIEYVKIQIKAFLKAVPCWLGLGIICMFAPQNGFSCLIARGILCMILPLPYLWFLYRKDHAFMNLLAKVIPLKVFKYINK